MRRSRLAAGLAVLGVVGAALTGCASSPSSTISGSPTSFDAASASSTIGASATPVSTLVPSPSAPVTASPTTPSSTNSAAGWALSTAGIGPLQLGHNFAQLRDDPVVKLDDNSLTRCPTLFITRADIQYAITFEAGTASGTNSRRIVEVSVLDRSGGGSAAGQVVGHGGVTLGSTARAVESAYPGGKWLKPSLGLDRMYVVDEGSAPITFGIVADAVAHIVVGGRDIPYEYCG